MIMCKNEKQQLVGTSEVVDKINNLISYIDLIDDAIFDYIESSSERKRSLGFTLASEMIDIARDASLNIIESVGKIRTVEEVRLEFKEEATVEASA